MEEVLCSGLMTANIYPTIIVCQALCEKSFAWIIWNCSQLPMRKLRHKEVGPASHNLLDAESEFEPWKVWPQGLSYLLWHNSASQATQDRLNFPSNHPNFDLQSPAKTLLFHDTFFDHFRATANSLSLDLLNHLLLPHWFWQWHSAAFCSVTVEDGGKNCSWIPQAWIPNPPWALLAVWLSIHSPSSIHSAPNIW